MDKLIGNEFIKVGGGKISIADVMKAEVVLLLFSGSWCPPCRGFLPAIRKFYNDVNKGCTTTKRVEIVFVSCDNEKEEFQEHLAELGFPAIPYESDKIADLEDDIEVEAIPIVPILSKAKGKVVFENARKLIQDSGFECFNKLKELSLK